MHSTSRPWWHQPLRIYQANNFEIDPREIDGDRIAQQCADLHCNAIIVDAGGGISTFYPTEVAHLTPNPWLRPGQDFFGDMVEGCRRRGIRVFARNDFGNHSLETHARHPDWAQQERDGSVREIYDVVYTCPTSPMFLEVPVRAFEEQIRRYDIDGVYINSLGGHCYCQRCLGLFREETGRVLPGADDWDDPDYRAFMEWSYSLGDRIAQAQYAGVRAAKPDCCYFIDAAGMQEHSWIRAKGQDLIRIGRFQSMVATEAFNDLVKGYPVMLASIVSRYVRSVSDHLGKPGAVFVSSFPGHSWPRLTQPVEEYRSYLASVFLNGCWGITPWYGHCEREDQRLNGVAGEIFAFMERHQDILDGARPEATVAIVYSRRTADHYGREDWKSRTMDPFFAACRCMIEAGLPFTIISDEQLETALSDSGSAQLQAIETFILPNVACLSDRAAAFLDAHVTAGGGIITDYETALYDETGVPRNDFALRSLGISRRSTIPDSAAEWDASRFHSYLEITDPQHPLMRGFGGTRILPVKGPRVEVEVADSCELICRYIARSDSLPPEKGWRSEPPSLPMVVAKGRCLYLAFPLFNLLARFRLPDHQRLFVDAVRLQSSPTPRVEASGPVELSVLRLADGRRAYGLINHTGAVLRQSVPLPLGPVRLYLPDEPSAVQALKNCPFSVQGAIVTLPQLVDFELLVVG